jgi:hypothetical protein
MNKLRARPGLQLTRETVSTWQPRRPGEGDPGNRKANHRFSAARAPESIYYIAEHVPAILEGWYLGQEAVRQWLM